MNNYGEIIGSLLTFSIKRAMIGAFFVANPILAYSRMISGHLGSVASVITVIWDTWIWAEESLLGNVRIDYILQILHLDRIYG